MSLKTLRFSTTYHNDSLIVKVLKILSFQKLRSFIDEKNE